MKLTDLFSIALGAILVNNFIFSQFLGCCPFLGVSKKLDTAVGMRNTAGTEETHSPQPMQTSGSTLTFIKKLLVL